MVFGTVKTHTLKVWPEFFGPIADGRKTFEIRRNDRDYCAGDVLFLCEFDPATEKYTGRWARRKISYVLEGGRFGLADGYCCIGFEAQECGACVRRLTK